MVTHIITKEKKNILLQNKRRKKPYLEASDASSFPLMNKNVCKSLFL